MVSIMLFLMALLFPSLRVARERVRRATCANNLRQWGIATQLYRGDHNDFLPTEGTYWAIEKPYTWFNVLPPYLGAPAYRDVERSGKLIKEFPALHVWICPSKNLSRLYKSGTGKNQFHYAMNYVLDGVGRPPNGSRYVPGFFDPGDKPIRAHRFRKKPHTVFMFDIGPNITCGRQNDVGTQYHGDYANVLYVDGGVAGFRSADFLREGRLQPSSLIWNHPRLYWGFTPSSP